MPITAKEALILSLAEKFTGKQVNTDILTEALELICEGYLFDAGMVYSMDQTGTFYLQERWVHSDEPMLNSFDTKDLDPKYRSYLANENLVFLKRSPASSPDELVLLDLFGATSLAVVAAVDENMRIFGMLVFSNILHRSPLSEGDKRALSVLVSMFVHYVGKRMYITKLSFTKTALESILDNTGIDIYVNDFYTHDILYVNKSMAAPYGGKGQFVGHKCWQVLFPGQTESCEFCPQKKLLDENGAPTRVYTWDYQRAFDGSWFRVFSAAFRWVDGRLAHVVSSADITDNKRNEELIQYLANYDSLTGLPNRRMLINEIEQRIAGAKDGAQGFLLFFDIDGFKTINDTKGHDAGDELLIQLGEFFTGIPMLKGSFFRHGGDEFVAILGSDVGESHIRSLANFIHTRFTKQWMLKKGPVFCNTSIGAACYPLDGTTAEELLHKADQAMYEIKKRGGAGLLFSQDRIV